jgi:hypothetical protein
MQVNRTWAIVGEVTSNDIDWLQRSSLQHRFPRREIDEDHYYTSFSPYSLKRITTWEPLEVVTSNQKEEMWLKLYFAERAILTTEETVYNKY